MHYTQEYLCLPKEQHTHPLYAYLVFENIAVKGITTQHLFIGYSPVIFAIPSIGEIDLSKQSIIKIFYSISPLEMESTVPKKDIVAILSLKKIKEQKTDNSFVYYFYNLYKQVQIAYAIPRVISLITVSSDNLFNLFPTDLHGQINEDYYIISLRYQGNACKQVEQAKKIVLSNVDASYYKEAYNLGKNHMQPLKEKSNFVFSEENSYTLKLPLPPNVIECRELELKDSFIHGIHKLLLFKILNHQRSQNSSTTLAHVHNAYATWRYKQGLGNYFFLCK